MKTINILFLFLIFLTSCDANKEDEQPDCSAVLCAVLEVKIELIDADTDLNYIDSIQIPSTDIVLKEEDLNINDWGLIKDNEEESIIILGVKDTFSITVPNKKSISIIMTRAAPKTNNCCDFGNIENGKAVNHESFYDALSNTLTIKI